MVVAMIARSYNEPSASDLDPEDISTYIVPDFGSDDICQDVEEGLLRQGRELLNGTLSNSGEAYDSFDHHGAVSSAAIPSPLAFKLALTQ